tara:strand:- start:1506 stop:3134 length:1629 start_codon:yes stop_codon:yes gene_type:complete
MSNINIFIKENIKSIGSGVHITPEIPEKKLNNAIKAFKCESFYESILAIQDGTLFGSSKEGFVFTGEKMIHHKHGEFIYSEIESVEYIEDVKVDDKGKEKIKKYVDISKSNKKYKFEYLVGINEEKFAEFLNKIITEFEDYEEEDQLKTISEMSDELKIAYLKIIINMTFIDDEEIDEKELAELFLLMTRLELNKESRFTVRAYITEISRENIQSIESLLEIIKNNSEASHYQSLMISLAKDLINVYFSTKDTTNRDFKFLDDNQSLFELSNEEIDLAYDTVENDYKLLKEDLDDDAIKKNAKELASKAAAAGAPLAAVYISGSVIGMSAAGITSGLATLGMGMGMTGGLAVIGIIGVLSYKGVKHLTGANELDKYKTRELMLHDVIKQTQKTISLIIDDVNYIVQKLNDTILNHSDQTEKIKKLTYMMAQFQGALKSVDNKSNVYQNSANRLQSPKILDDERFKSLTEEATKKSLYDFVIVNYELQEIEIDNKKVKKLILKEDVKTETLDKMSEIFKALGYFDMDNILKSKASGMIKGVFG